MSALDGLSAEQLRAIADGSAFQPAKTESPADPLADFSVDELKELAGEPATERTSLGKAVLVGAQDAAAFGGRAALSGASESVGTGLGTFLGLKGMPIKERLGFAFDEAKKAYTPGREKALEEVRQAEEDRPGATLAGNVAGIITTLPVALGKGVAGGMRAGAATGLLSSASEGRNAEDTFYHTAGGAAAGGILAKGGEKLVEKLGSKALSSTAGRQAFRALGPGAKAARVNMARGEVEHIGRTMIDQGIINGRPKGYEKIVKEVTEHVSKWGDELGHAIDKLDELAVKRGIDTHGVDLSKVGSEVLDAVAIDPKVPGGRQFNERAKEFVQEFLMNNEPRQGIKATESLKTKVGKLVNWDKNPADYTDIEKLHAALYRALKNGSEETALNLAGIAEKELSGAFKNSKAIYGALSEAKRIVSDRAARDLANRFISPSDYLTGGIGAAAGWSSGENIVDSLQRAAIGGALGLVNKGARQFGPQIAAKGASSLSKFLRLGEKVAERAGANPEILKRALIFGAAPTSGQRPSRAAANE